MRRACLIAFLASFLALLCSNALAEDSFSGKPDRLQIRFDNDFMAIGHSSDTNYTMGLGWVVTSNRPAGDSFIDSNPLLQIMDGINGATGLPSIDEHQKSTRSYQVQDNAFTPSCLHTAAECSFEGKPVNQDRPYANIIWTGVSRTVTVSESESVRTELDFGLYGTNIGYVVQTGIHKWCCTNNLPQGWGDQIGDGGAPTFLYKRVNYTRPSISFPLFKGELHLGFSRGFWVGWNTWPTVGVSAELGSVRIEYDASLVLYNQALQGAWGGTNSFSYSYDQIEHFVQLAHFRVDLNALLGGFNDSRSSGWALTQNWKTRDLKVSGEQAVHYWGGLEYWRKW